MSGSNQDRSMEREWEWEWMKMEASSPVEDFPYKLPQATWSPWSPGTVDFYNSHVQEEKVLPEEIEIFGYMMTSIITETNKQHKNRKTSPVQEELLAKDFISTARYWHTDELFLVLHIRSTKRVVITDGLPVGNTECSSLNETCSHQSLVAITVADKQHKNIERSLDEDGLPPIELITDVNVLEPSISSTKQVAIADYLPVDNIECSSLNQTSSHQSLVAITVADKQHKNTGGSPDESGIPPTQIIIDVNVPVDNTECSYLKQTSLNKSLVAITVADKQRKNIERSLDEGGIPPTQLISDVNVPEHSSLNQASSSLSLDTFTLSDEQHKSKTGGRPRKLITDINVLLPYSGFTQQAAAEQLNIGKSTLKRSCKILGIKEWSELKNKSVTVEAGIYNQPSLTTRPSKKAKTQCARPVIVKAMFKGDTTKVKLLSSSKKVDLDEQLARKLNIEPGSFKIKHMDEDNDEILISTDSDFEDCITNSESQGNMTIRLLVEQIII